MIRQEIIAQLLAVSRRISSAPAAVSFSDDFNRADNASIGANWTEDIGTFAIADNSASLTIGSYNKHVARYTALNTATSNQYAKITLAAVPGGEQYMELCLRAADWDIPYYSITVRTDTGVCFWRYNEAPQYGGYTDLASASLAVTSGDVIGATITGISSSTVCRVWKNPSGLPVDSGNWNGDSSPDLSFTNPSVLVDTGLQVGFGGLPSAANIVGFDDFFGGDVAVAAASSWTEEITDAFASDGTPPTGWTEINGSWAAAGGVLGPDDTTANRVIVNNTDVSTATHFVKFTFSVVAGSCFDGLVLRHAAGNVRYVIRYDQLNSTLHLRYTSGANAYTTFHTIASVTFVDGDYMAATVTGTDTATEFKIWKNPDAGTTPDTWGAADYTVNSGNWNGAPGTYHNTGTGVGLYAGSATLISTSDFDNFSAGSE